MPYQTWTDQEQEYVLANRDRLKLAAIARHLGRTVASVVGMLIYYGLSQKKVAQATWENCLRRLHKAGRSDSDIAARLGCTRATVQRRRVLLGLPANPYRDQAGRYRRQMRNAEADSLADLRWRPGRIRKLQEG